MDRVILSTDSEEYASIGRQYGAETPFLRPPELASDTSIDFEFVQHAVEWLALHESWCPDIVVRLYATTPLVRHEDVDQCIQVLMDDPKADSAIMMTPAHQHPRKAARMTTDGLHVVSYITERGTDVSPSNRQGYVPAFNRQSLPVVSRTETILKLRSLTGDSVRFHLVPRETAFDIDDALDFLMAEWLVAHAGKTSAE